MLTWLIFAGPVTYIQLSEINKLANFQHITCQVKVLSIENPVEEPRGKKKQDIMIGDSSGTAILHLFLL